MPTHQLLKGCRANGANPPSGGGGGSGIVVTDLELELDASNSSSWDSTNAVWEDLTANGNDYTFGAQPAFVASPVAYLDLDSVNGDDEATGGNTGFVYGASAWTLMVTFYMNTITGFANTLWCHGTNAANQGLFLAVDTGNAIFVEFGGGTPAALYGSSGITLATWHIVMLRYTGTALEMYLDNTLVGTRTATLGLVAGTPMIGDNMVYDGDNVDGRLHHVAYWSQALSTADRNTSYSAISGRL